VNDQQREKKRVRKEPLRVVLDTDDLDELFNLDMDDEMRVEVEMKKGIRMVNSKDQKGRLPFTDLECPH
jgi:hypothetical protein